MEFLIYHPLLRTPSTVVEEAATLESLGYDGMVMPDHLFVLDFQVGTPLPYPHPLAILAAAAAVTRRLKLLSLVSNNLARGPVELAHQTATLANLAPGRTELAIGTGWFAAEHLAAGVGFPTGGERIEMLLESVHICRQLFERAEVHHEGKHYRVSIPQGGFPPVTSRVPIMVGAAGPRMIREAARVADRVDLQPDAIAGGGADLQRYNAYTFELLAAGAARAQEAARAANRTVSVSASPFVYAASDEADADQMRRQMAEFVDLPLEALEQSFGTIIGTPDQIADKLKRYPDAGCDRVHLQALNVEAATRLGPTLQALRS